MLAMSPCDMHVVMRVVFYCTTHRDAVGGERHTLKRGYLPQHIHGLQTLVGHAHRAQLCEVDHGCWQAAVQGWDVAIARSLQPQPIHVTHARRVQLRAFVVGCVAKRSLDAWLYVWCLCSVSSHLHAVAHHALPLIVAGVGAGEPVVQVHGAAWRQHGFLEVEQGQLLLERHLMAV